ncbi:MAG: ion channel, partial [Acidimicrobiales bacterium]
RSNLSGADLTDANLDGASLHDADLSAATLRGIRGASNADWIGATFSTADFTGSYLARREAIDQNYLHEFRSRGRIQEFLYRLWWVTSDCGRSFLRWGVLTLAFSMVFGGIYRLVDIDYGSHETAISSFYFSVVTLTTLGYGDVLPVSQTAQIIVMLEVVLGYGMLGGLMSIFASKMGRRGE